MDPLPLLFDRMDAWRHFPNYQLERRADVFFSLNIPQALEYKLGYAFNPVFVPELPLHVQTLYPGRKSDKSFKADYLAVSSSMKIAVLVELKTETQSENTKQADYLKAARITGVHTLLKGLLTIFKATNAKRKYLHLLESLETMGLLQLPATFHETVRIGEFEKAKRMIDQTRITPIQFTRVLYIVPNRSTADRMTFEEFSKVVDGYDDCVSRRFSTSLLDWADVKAGRREQAVL